MNSCADLHQVSLAEECEYNTGLAKLPVATVDASTDEVRAGNKINVTIEIAHEQQKSAVSWWCS